MRTTLWDDFKRYILHSNNTLNHLLAINAAVFLVFGIFWVILRLFSLDADIYEMAERFVAFPSHPTQALLRPWTIITYQFIHAGVFHIVVNMLIFNFAGRIFREFLGDRKLLSTYILGGICGAGVYMAAYHLFPAFALARNTSMLVGASASVMAVLAGIGTLLPNYTVSLLLIGPVKLMYIVVVLVLIDFLSIAGPNAGGHLAHIGGVIWGVVYVSMLRNGRDLAGWFTTLADGIKNKLTPRKKRSSMRYLVTEGAPATAKKRSQIKQEEVDAILDKINQSGYDSLSQREKDLLFKASQDN